MILKIPPAPFFKGGAFSDSTFFKGGAFSDNTFFRVRNLRITHSFSKWGKVETSNPQSYLCKSKD